MKVNIRETLRRLFKSFLDVIVASAAYPVAFLIIHQGKVPSEVWMDVIQTLPVLVIIRFGFLYRFGTFRSLFGYAGLREILNIIYAISLSSLLFFGAVMFTFSSSAVTPWILLVDWVLSISFLSGVRVIYRVYWDRIHRPIISASERKRALIVGATPLAEHYIRYRKHTRTAEEIVGIADDEDRVGMEIYGVPVLCSTSKLKKVVRDERIDVVIFAYPEGNEEKILKTVRDLAHTGVAFKTVPAPSGENTSPSVLKDLDVADLYRIKPVEIDEVALRELIKERSVLITGAAGSIGSELARQIAAFAPDRLILLDRNESGIFEVAQDVRKTLDEAKIIPRVADICNRHRIDEIFDAYRPDFVFHAAAYKHVPLMESHPGEAFTVNVIGTYLILSMSSKYGVQKFLYISTDKAVEPASIMGATKFLAERIVENWPEKDPERVIVRFGNVIDSVGSVVPIFRKRILNGQPLEVTDPEAKRYFMSIKEAVMLVLQSFIMGGKGEIFVLDMGEPVKVKEIAERMISLAGLIPEKDIPIVYTGLRPGEKKEERLFDENEVKRETSHPRVFMAERNGSFTPEFLNEISEISEKLTFPYMEDERARQFIEKWVALSNRSPLNNRKS